MGEPYQLVIFALLLCASNEVLAQVEPVSNGEAASEVRIFENESSLELNLGRAELLRISEAADFVIIGDSAIADTTLIDDTTLLLTAKAVGSTNIIILDSQSRVIINSTIFVKREGTHQITVRRAAEPTQYICRYGAGCIQGNLENLEAPRRLDTPSEDNDGPNSSGQADIDGQ